MKETLFKNKIPTQIKCEDKSTNSKKPQRLSPSYERTPTVPFEWFSN